MSDIRVIPLQFSGEEFSVDKDQGLNRFCDFLLSKSLTPYIVEAPVIILEDSRDFEMDGGEYLNYIYLVSSV